MAARDGTMRAPSQVMIEHRLCAGTRTHIAVKCLNPTSRKLGGEQKIQGEKRLRSVGVTPGQVTLELGRGRTPGQGSCAYITDLFIPPPIEKREA